MSRERVLVDFGTGMADANIFAMMGRARAALKRAGRGKEGDEMVERVRAAKSYEAAQQIIYEYAEPV